MTTIDTARDDRKSAALAAQNVHAPEGSRLVNDFALARDILRSNDTCQAAVGAEQMDLSDPRFAPVFFLDGEEHKKRRQTIARFFTPKAIDTTYREVMEQTSDALVARVRAEGSARLDEIAFELTVGVAAEIVGLTESDPRAMAKRIQSTLIATRTPSWNKMARPFGLLAGGLNALRFFVSDVRPAIKARRVNPRVDVISHLIEQNAPSKAILIECMTYAVAGMVTTREFIVMAAWHMFDNPALRERYVTADEQGQADILNEILRLEPVAAMLQRRAQADLEFESGKAADGELLAMSIRGANTDEAIVGACPHALDPDRVAGDRVIGAYMSFGEGSHRCPGSKVAMAESRVFLDRLMRVPGLKLAKAPKMTWNKGIEGYELRGALITCDKV
jgi:cytochrome P450